MIGIFITLLLSPYIFILVFCFFDCIFDKKIKYNRGDIIEEMINFTKEINKK